MFIFDSFKPLILTMYEKAPRPDLIRTNRYKPTKCGDFRVRDMNLLGMLEKYKISLYFGDQIRLAIGLRLTLIFQIFERPYILL